MHTSFQYTSCLKMEMQTNDVNDILEAFLLDSQASQMTPSADEIYLNKKAIKSTASDNEINGINKPCSNRFLPVETSDSDKTNRKRNNGFVSQVTCLRVCSNFVLVIGVVLVVGLLLIPLILYFTSLPSDYETLSSLDLLEYEDCSVSCYIYIIQQLLENNSTYVVTCCITVPR